MRLVLDTNVLARATPNHRGAARELLRRLFDSEHILVASEYLLNELTRVLRYPRVMATHRLNEAAIDEFLAALWRAAELVELPSQIEPISSDPADDPIIFTAIVGKADVLCTWDRAFYAPAVQLRLASYGVRVMKYGELLELIAS
jgi:putative PIN family toxin of toxin-antitoxin system